MLRLQQVFPSLFQLIGGEGGAAVQLRHRGHFFGLEDLVLAGAHDLGDALEDRSAPGERATHVLLRCVPILRGRRGDRLGILTPRDVLHRFEDLVGNLHPPRPAGPAHVLQNRTGGMRDARGQTSFDKLRRRPGVFLGGRADQLLTGISRHGGQRGAIGTDPVHQIGIERGRVVSAPAGRVLQDRTPISQ